MYNWIQEPKGKDKEIIEKYYCGVKIIMNDGKILLENVYTLEEIYLKIDELAESAPADLFGQAAGVIRTVLK